MSSSRSANLATVPVQATDPLAGTARVRQQLGPEVAATGPLPRNCSDCGGGARGAVADDDAVADAVQADRAADIAATSVEVSDKRDGLHQCSTMYMYSQAP